MKHTKVRTNKFALIPFLVGASLIFGLVSTLAIALVRMGKRPINRPEKFVAQPDKCLVVCIGDSITQGTISADYVHALTRNPSLAGFTFVNAGVNGDLAYNALMRKDSVTALNPAYVILLLGTNDANATLSQENARMYMKDKGLPEKPTKEWFERNLSDLISSIKIETSAKIAILSLPVIGEKLDSMEIQTTREYSAIVQSLANNNTITYLPLNEMQVAFLEAANHEPGILYSPKESIELMVKNAYRHYILHEDWNAISLSRGLLLTTDTLHQNDFAGDMISGLIGDFLLEKM